MGLMDRINENIEFLKGEFDEEAENGSSEHAEIIKQENEKRLREMETSKKENELEEELRNSEELKPVVEAVVEEEEEVLSEDDAELKKFIEQSVPKIYVIGTGGSGCNTVNRMVDVGIYGAGMIAMNTDAQHLLKIHSPKKVLLGKKKTKGLGAGSNPEVGEAAAMESAEEIKNLLKDANLVFVTCGMGGGTGTGSAAIIAKAAKENGALVIGIVTMPFTSEGTKRMDNAMEGLKKLRAIADTTIAIPNDKLLFYVPDLPLNSAFKAADLVLTNSVKGITELITKPGLVNLDFADVRTIIENSGIAMIGLGETANVRDKNRVVVAAEKSLKSPLIDVNVGQANKCLINIMGGEDLTLGEAEAAVNAISTRIAKDAHIIWGATIDKQLSGGEVRVLAVLAGMKEDGSSAAESAMLITEEKVEESIGLDSIM
ncbi:MAG: cell division protein FtsZ [Candidatus Micrarchaeota archaeon]